MNMGETSHDDTGSQGLELVVKHTGDGVRHRSKVTIKDLDFFYGTTQALKHVCLDLPEHQVTGMIGPSGCGKSTLLRVLNRMYSLYPDQRATGTVLLDGEDITGRIWTCAGCAAGSAWCFRRPQPSDVDLRERRLRDAAARAPVARRAEQARGGGADSRALWSEVKDRLRSPAEGLSGGQQQRLCIARALSTRPEIILMDEPTSALDPLSTMKIENLIDELKRTVTIVLITHNLQQAARCADQMAFFYLGELIESGTAMQMFTSPQRARTQNYISGRFG